MNKHIVCILLSGYCITAQAQDSAVALPVTYTTSLNNYIRTWTAVKPDTTNANFTTGSSLSHSRLRTQYFDGLGRPIQTVAKQGSYPTGGSAADLVSATVYDEWGRVQRSYLPFGANSTGGNTSISDGGFKMNPFAQQSHFYSDAHAGSPIYGQGETYYYGKTELEASPLNRVERTYAPGNSWVHDGRGVTMKYWVNKVADSVRIWTVTNSGMVGVFGSYATSAMYLAGELFKNVTEDEHDKQVIEFRDREGKVVLKKVQFSAGADTGSGKGHYGWLCTYYIYDDYGLLRCVIQPRGVELLAANSWNMTWSSSVVLNEQCFRYEYDGKRRPQMKKVPAAGEVYLVHDARDRLVLVQDANIRAGSPVKWLYMQYDSINRPIATGLWNNSSSLSTHYSGAYGSTAYPNLSGQTIEELTNTFYDNYNWRSSYGNPLSATRSTSYDSYLASPSNATFPYVQDATTQSSDLKGRVTGTRTKALGTATYLYSVNFYDNDGRLIQVQATNLSGGTDMQVTQYAFAGTPVLAIAKTEKANSPAQTSVAVTRLGYDSLLRAVKTEKRVQHTQVNGNAMSSYKTIAAMEYDVLGQLKKKELGAKPGAGTELAKQEYEYNIRGWLLGINKSYTSSANSDQYFALELGYDKNASLGSFTPQYNGNISGAVWKGEGDQQRRKYDFSYDVVNRLTGADFNQYVSGSGGSAVFNRSAGMDFSVSGLSYDANGNILTQKQRGWKLSGSATIDSLTYNYIPHSNRLLNVIDGENDVQTKLGDFRTSSLHPYAGSKSSGTEDYVYDDNGNMVKDLNKDLVTYGGGDGIEYNYLNLPAKVTIKKDGSSNKGHIEYVYDAAGNKLKKTVYEPGVDTTVTLYLGGAVYHNDTLELIGHEEGRIRFVPVDSSVCTPQPNRFVYDYFLKDHLGNVRMTLTEQKEDICYPAATVEDGRYQQEDNYYDIANGRRISKATTGATQSSFEDKLYRTHGGLTGEKTGLGMVLKVMSGDQVKIAAESFYMMPMGGDPGAPLSMAVSDILTAFAASGPVAAVKGSIGATDIQGIGSNSSDLTNFIGRTPLEYAAKAYVNWILFDEQLKYVSSGANQVEQSQGLGTYKLHDYFINNPVNVNKSGYIYIFVSNESNLAVYFDNLVVTHTPGAILDETHYYPFGLTMMGISSHAAGKLQNRYKYNGKEEQSKEFSDGSGLEWTDYGARMYDNQIGRWHCQDNLSEKYISSSPYHYCANNPISYFDLDGNEFTDAAWGWVNNLISDVNKRQEEIVKSIAEKKARLANGKGANRLNRQIKRLESDNAELDATRFEIGVLQASDQKYDVVMSNEYNEEGTVYGTGTNAAATRFNFKTGTVEMVMNNGASIGSFAHELKHSYQFETGEISLGPKLSDEKVYNHFLYDKHDEVAGYKRGYLFGSGLPYNVNELPDHYKDYPTGPVDAKTHPNLGAVILNMPIEKQKKHLQSVAKGTGHAFRINSITYYIPISQ